MDLNAKQKENVKKFILTVSEDEAVAYILKILDDEYKYMKVNDDDNLVAEEFLTDERFAKFYDAILQHVPNIDND
jgi:disulfide oxidoreductase YuzD